ncbi:MAG: hypothetical protein EP329_19680 [Deltaproteobacteria bacterium]|nr:MAG: hypothetical protein EP329_19680 [Deltaproteobacteria bacterium]
MFGLALVLSACPADKKLPIGSSCNSGDQCVSGLCAGQVCLDPQGDDDGDTLVNSLEQTLGSDPLNPDTDGDGIVDGAELDGVVNVDTDGDGLADIIESATNDLDGDCITDQYDAENTVQNADLSPMRDVVCSDLGVCAGQDRALFGVLCPEDVAVCDYTNVVGYVDPEVTCDGVDDNCDGAADDGFPDRDDDGIADCVDTDWDNDDVADDVDNCPFVVNAGQEDAQEDGVGDACAADHGLAFTLAPIVSVTAGAPFDVTVRLEDDNGTLVTRFHGDVTLTLGDAVAVRAADGDTASGATLTGTTTATAVAGVATFTGLTIAPPGTGLALTAASADLGSATSDAFDVLSGELAELRPSGAPATVTAGDALSVTLTAYDAYDNVLASYAGAVSFSATDPDATLPAEFTFGAGDAGTHTFDGIVLRTAGAQTVTVSDASGATLATVEVTVESAAAASFGVAGLPETVTAGAATSLTVSARDAFGNVATDYVGTVTFGVDDGAATVPADHAFVAADAGAFTTTELVLRTAGSRTVTVGDGTLSGSAAVTVVHADAAALVVEASPAPFTAGAPFSITVTVVDAFGNVVTDFAGTVGLTSSDPLATLPSAYTFSPSDQGVHVFTGVTLVSSGEHTVSASSSTGASVGGAVAVTVESGSDVVFALTGIPDPATAGVPFDVTVTVKDTFGNVVTDYVGTIALLTSDDAATLPAPVALTGTSGGVATFSGVVLKTAGAHTLTAADAGQGISQSVGVTVVSGAAASLAINGPSTITAGTPFTVTVTAEDAWGNAATGYAATLAFSSSDEDATLPSDGTFPAGSGAQPYGGIAVTQAGAQTVTVSDPQNSALTATLNVNVSPAGAASVAISGAPTTRVAGVAFALTATLYDAFGNVATGYTGSLAVTTSDAAGVVPAAHTFTAGDAGSYAFSGVTLKTAGDQTVTVSAPGNGALTAQVTVAVTPAAAASLAVTPSDAEVAAGVTTSIVVRANDAFGNRATGYTGTVHFTTTDGQATLPGDYAFGAGDAGQHVFGGVVFRTVGAQTVTVTDLASASLTGQASVTVGQGAQIVYELTGLPTSTTAGTALTATLSVKDTFGNPITGYSGTVAFTAVDATSGQAVSGATLPPSYTFVSGDGGSHTFSGIVLRSAGTTTVRAAEVGSVNVSASAVVNVAPAAMSRLAIENAPAGVTAGTAFGLRVTAYDAFDNVAAGYTGPVAFSASRQGATLPSDGTLTAGTRSFSGLVLTLAGDTLLTVADGAVSTSVTLPVGHGAPASLDLTALPSTVAAGAAQSLTATVRDAWGNVATGFTGSASVVTNDPALDPTSIPFGAADHGQRTFTVTFQTVGSRQVTVDAGGALSATRATTVEPGAATRFVVSAFPSTLTAGTRRTITITLYDAYGNVATGGISGSFTISSTDPAATIAPAALTIGPGAGGTGSSDVTLVTAGDQTVTVAHTVSSVELSTNVKPAAAAKLAVSDLPPTVTAGVSTAVVVRVTDTYGNTVSSYVGVVHVSASDDAVTLAPGSSLTFPAGQPASVTLTATFETAGDQSLDFLDTGLGAGGAAATSTTVRAAAPRDLVATPATGSAVAGTAFNFTVAIYDAYGNLAPTYTGTVSFTSNDTQATLPAATAYTTAFGGTHTFSATLRTAGTRVITCSGTGLAGASSDDLTRTVSPSPTLDHFTVVPSMMTVTAGGTLSATVTPYDAWNNVITTFSGAVAMSVDDPEGSIPSPVTLSGATQVSPIVLYTAGAVHVTATWGGVSDSGTVTVVPGSPVSVAFATQPSDGYVATPLPTFAVAFYDAYGNVATNMPATTVGLALGRNAGPGLLGATTAVATSSGVATFSSAQIDAPGRGYDLVASSQLGTVRSERFDVSWRPATLVGTPFVSGSGGCRDVYYTLAQTNGHPTDVLVEYRVGTGVWRRATQRPGTAADGEGTRGVATSFAGVEHAFAWDVFADVGLADATVTARVTPVIDGVAGVAKTTGSFSVSYAWRLGSDKLDITASIPPGPVAIGDYDRNGLDDVLLMGREAAIVDVFFQTSPGAFTEISKQLDLSAPGLVDIAPWQPAPRYTKGFFALGGADGLLHVFTSSVVGEANVGWGFSSTPACPGQTGNPPIAMAVGEVYGTRDVDVVVACAGDGGVQGPTLSIISDFGQGWVRSMDIGVSKIPVAVAVADLGHNGWQDVIVGDSGGLRTLISQYGDGFCQSSSCGAQVIDARAPTDIAVADFDNDGQLDVITVDGGGVATYFRGDVVIGPQGVPLQYLAPQGLDVPLNVAGHRVTARDVNDDGVVDVVVGSYEEDAVEVLLGGDLASWGVIDLLGAAGKGVNGLWVGDLDKDGRTDIVAGRDDTSAAAVAWLPGKAFQQCRPSFETSGAARYMAGAQQLEVVDVDGDGRHDAMWRTSYSAAIQGLMVGYGDGAGGYQRGYASYVTSQSPTDMAIGDLDNDGLMDAVLNDGYTDNVDVALQSASEPGTFYQGFAPTFFNDASADSLVVVDADNDRRNDLFYIGAGALQRYYGNGSTLVGATPVTLGAGSPTGLGHADVNKDGYQDFAYYGYVNDADSVCLLMSSGPRGYATSESCVAVQSRDGRVQLVDLDGDGAEEMVYISRWDYYAETLIAVRRQQTPDTGDFGLPEEVPTCFGGTDLRFADANADGRTDILLSCGSEGGGTSGAAVMVLYQGADGGFGATTGGFGTFGYQAWGLAVGDANGDLFDDAYLGAAVTRRDSDGVGVVTPASAPASDGSYVYRLAVADLDGNGLLDAVTAGGQRFSVSLQPEPGKLVAPTTYVLSGVSSVYGLVVEDVDGDGRPDVVLGVYSTIGRREVRIYQQILSTPGAFDVDYGYTTLNPTGSGYPNVIAVEDFAGAGVPSVLVSQATYSSQDEFDVFLQNSSGGFTQIPSDPYTSTFPTQVVSAGFGWFGRKDYREPFVAGRCGTAPCVVIAQIGACDLQPPVCFKTKTTLNLSGGAAAPLYTSISGAVVADVDKDGFDDIVASLGGSNGSHVYALVRQNPNVPGTFFALQAFQGAQTTLPLELRLVDLNHDGRLDIVAQYGAGSTNAYEILLGTGTGASFGQGFAVATALTPSDAPFVVGDLDRDGWPDLLTLSTNDAKLLLAPQR